MFKVKNGNTRMVVTYSVFTSTKLTIEAIEQGVKYIQN